MWNGKKKATKCVQSQSTTKGGGPRNEKNRGQSTNFVGFVERGKNLWGSREGTGKKQTKSDSGRENILETQRGGGGVEGSKRGRKP